MAERIVTRFLRKVREVENLWIPMRDGAKLACHLWIPADAEKSPVPAIIEYMPYRKRDLLRLRDQPIHHYFAGYGYACLRVDTRGAGDSDGVLEDMWTEEEIDDGQDIIAWLAGQSWCTGKVGMIGKSWSGFSGLQAAARAPEALKAIVTVCSAEDRYTTTLHYTGGAMLTDSVWWGSSMLMFNSMPPDPVTRGKDWEKLWRARLKGNKPMMSDWLDHQHRDAYWREGSVAGRLKNFKAAVYSVGGWADYLSRAVPRILSQIPSPGRGLIGPWGHQYPQDATPGPAMGFLQDCVRWFDRWLKGTRNGIDREPLLRVWMQDSVRPSSDYVTRPGRWVAERSWPSPRIKPKVLKLNAGTLDAKAAPEAALTHRSPQSLGLCSPEWLGGGVKGELPRDQREDDGRSLVFDTAPLRQRTEILGETVVTLELTVDKPVAHVIARLCDVHPGGASTRVTFGVLNLCHRTGHDRPTPMKPGKRTRVEVRMPSVAYAFPPGHKIRIALSTSYWPIVWPSPEAPLLTVFTGKSEVALPVRRPDPRDAVLPAFGKPENGPTTPFTTLEGTTLRRSIEREPISGHTTVILQGRGGGLLGPVARYRIDPIGTEMAHSIEKRLDIDDDNPLSARAEVRQTMEMGRKGWRISIAVSTVLTCDARNFYVDADATASLNGRKVSARRWKTKHRRNLL
ncbi:MAG: CocE/NonD family hydrolase [Alphaproteobacteria bacterium]|nr:CocE/NonD family hydrolase [Alphaproteobacteria bacterium]